jgi:hypothetical protein
MRPSPKANDSVVNPLNIDDVAHRNNQQNIGCNPLPSATLVEGHHGPTEKKSTTIATYF